MKTRATAIFAACAVATGAALCASAGEDIATSAAFGSFHMDTSGAPIVMSSAGDASLMTDWPVTYRVGETVTATAPDGAVSTLASSAAAAGSVAFAPTAGGVWRLENSNGDTALVGVGWSVFNDGWSLDLGSISPFMVNTKVDGPDRRGPSFKFPPVAYSGDGWMGDSVAASTLTFIPSEGEETSLDLAGTGVVPFSFGSANVWTVRLGMADGSEREATIVVSDGFSLIFR